MQKEQKNLITIDGNTLMEQIYEPIQFSVEKILPHGLFILAGSPKIGKSWLSLNLCTAIAKGDTIWGLQAEQGNVLYLALEDNYNRLQTRIKQIETDKQDISRLHMATASFGLRDGLLEQIRDFLSKHENTNLIIIDTLEHIRNTGADKSLYSCDYRDMTRLREITNNYKLTLMLVHHTRKMYDPDPLNTISGSTGLVGSVDGVFVLEKKKRTDNEGKLTIANRDTEGHCFDLLFDSEKCRWIFVGNNSGDDDRTSDMNNLCTIINNFLQEEWNGTATDLYEELSKTNKQFDFTPATLAKKLKSLSEILSSKFNILVDFDRQHSGKLIVIKRKNN